MAEFLGTEDADLIFGSEDSDVVVGFRSVEYDRDAVARDMAAAGLPLDLLREPPVPHPLVDPGTISIQAAEAPAQA